LGGFTEPFPEGEDAEGFLDTAQGDVEGVAVLGFMKNVFQAVLEEVQLIQEDVVMALLGLAGAVGQGAAQMFGVAESAETESP